MLLEFLVVYSLGGTTGMVMFAVLSVVFSRDTSLFQNVLAGICCGMLSVIAWVS